jgi:hypothetical protein
MECTYLEVVGLAPGHTVDQGASAQTATGSDDSALVVG